MTVRLFVWTIQKAHFLHLVNTAASIYCSTKIIVHNWLVSIPTKTCTSFWLVVQQTSQKFCYSNLWAYVSSSVIENAPFCTLWVRWKNDEELGSNPYLLKWDQNVICMAFIDCSMCEYKRKILCSKCKTISVALWFCYCNSNIADDSVWSMWVWVKMETLYK